MSRSYLTDETLPRSAYVILTLKCNLRCPHCYLEAGPERKETMPMELRKKVIREIAKNRIQTIIFTGGEPTTEMEKLIDTLDCAVKTYRETSNTEPQITLQTNAHFLTELNDIEIKRQLEMLKSKGVCRLHIASRDGYHCIPFPKLDRIAEIAFEVFRHEKGDKVWGVIITGATGAVTPIGRARIELPEHEWQKENFISEDYCYIIINVDGKIYPCCWQATPVMGDLSREPLIEIINRARQEGSIFKKLAEKEGFDFLNPEKDLGISKEEFGGLLTEFGPCGACAEYFRKYNKKSAFSN